MKDALYLFYGLAILGVLATVEYRGWSVLPINEVKTIPATVRDNPGAYRSVYRGAGRYTGGK